MTYLFEVGTFLNMLLQDGYAHEKQLILQLVKGNYGIKPNPICSSGVNSKTTPCVVCKEWFF